MLSQQGASKKIYVTKHTKEQLSTILVVLAKTYMDKYKEQCSQGKQGLF